MGWQFGFRHYSNEWKGMYCAESVIKEGANEAFSCQSDVLLFMQRCIPRRYWSIIL
jgi:hypothetical protein